MRKKILIVDDNTELLELLEMTVSDAGFRVSTASTGPEALLKARSTKPDLLVLDLILPDLDGFAVCEAVRRDRELARIPVIILTGLTSEFTRYAGLECGANEYVKKPVSPNDLVSKIRHWLDVSEANAVQSHSAEELPERDIAAAGLHARTRTMRKANTRRQKKQRC